MTFNFTDSKTDIDSSVVWEAYYNGALGELAVVLSSGHGYVYSGVPKELFERLIDDNNSAGALYSKQVKPDYGPGRSLGYVGDESDEFQPYANPGLGTPKNLVYSIDAVVTNGPVTHFNLGEDGSVSTKVPARTKHKHSVTFEVEGLIAPGKTFDVEAASVDEAIGELEKATSALGIDVKVKEVRVYFE